MFYNMQQNIAEVTQIVGTKVITWPQARSYDLKTVSPCADIASSYLLLGALHVSKAAAILMCDVDPLQEGDEFLYSDGQTAQ
jgi:hypothetical protein